MLRKKVKYSYTIKLDSYKQFSWWVFRSDQKPAIGIGFEPSIEQATEAARKFIDNECT